MDEGEFDKYLSLKPQADTLQAWLQVRGNALGPLLIGSDPDTGLSPIDVEWIVRQRTRDLLGKTFPLAEVRRSGIQDRAALGYPLCWLTELMGSRGYEDLCRILALTQCEVTAARARREIHELRTARATEKWEPLLDAAKKHGVTAFDR